MELHIIKDKTNPMLKRREVSMKITSKGTPSRIEVKNKLAAMANSRPELIVIEHLDTAFGKTELTGTASVYETEERLNQLAHQHLLARGVPKPKEGEAAKEAPQAAAPAAKQETKPEVKEEKKQPEKK